MDFKYKLGLKMSKKDDRDLCYILPSKKIEWPSHFSLKNKIKIIFKQGEMKSCTADSICQQMMILNEHLEIPSRLYEYFNSRRIAGSECFDDGVDLRSAYKALIKYNWVPENEYPYEIKNVLNNPPLELYIKAIRNPYVNYFRSVIQNLYNLKYIISQQKIYIVFGAHIYDTF